MQPDSWSPSGNPPVDAPRRSSNGRGRVPSWFVQLFGRRTRSDKIDRPPPVRAYHRVDPLSAMQILRARREHPEWSIRLIARTVKRDKRTVSRWLVRGEMVTRELAMKGLFRQARELLQWLGRPPDLVVWVDELEALYARGITERPLRKVLGLSNDGGRAASSP